MKEFICKKCESKDLFLKKNGDNTGLYCSDCGSWQKRLGKNEVVLFEKFKRRNTKPQDRYESVDDIINQLEWCNFTDDIGHPLFNNVAFIKLLEIAKKSEINKGV